MAEKRYEEAKVTKLPNSEVEIDVSVSQKTLEGFREKAVKHLTEEVTIPGFRKGHVPEKILLEKVGEMAILEEAAEELIKEVYPDVVVDNKLDLIGRPSIAITKLALGNPLEFKITGALFPVFDIPNHKQIAKEIIAKRTIETITEKEIDNVVEEIQKIRTIKKEDGTEEKPELTDDFVKTIGEFENVVDFKSKIKENLQKEKEFRAKEKERLSIIDSIIQKVEIPLPRILVEGELDRMFTQLNHDLKRINQTLPAYLSQIKKNEEELRKEWRKDAEHRVKFELVLDKIANIENIKAADDDVEKEVNHIVEHYTDAEPDRVREYVMHQLRNEAVFKFLESQK